MPVTIAERFFSGNRDAGGAGPITIEYLALGSDVAADVLAQIAVDVPLTYDGLPRQSAPKMEFKGNGLWYISASYALRQEPAPPQQIGSPYRWTYRTGGGTVRRTHAPVVAQYAGPGITVIPDHKGAINVSDSGIEGVDIVVPNGLWTRSTVISEAQATEAYINHLHDVTGSTNNATFKGRAAGEVLYVESVLSSRGDGGVDIEQSFQVSRNVTGQTVAGVTGVAKKGFEYLDVFTRQADDPAAKAPVKKIVAIYVHEVYPAIDFGTLDPP